jgi:predicted adenine nucleotide alpha hydrolase (AANH) superfamily ATPase
VPFIYHDWRPAYYDGRRLAREYGLYSQRYCGCIFSEYERFREAGPVTVPRRAGGTKKWITSRRWPRSPWSPE